MTLSVFSCDWERKLPHKGDPPVRRNGSHFLPDFLTTHCAKERPSCVQANKRICHPRWSQWPSDMQHEGLAQAALSVLLCGVQVPEGLAPGGGLLGAPKPTLQNHHFKMRIQLARLETSPASLWGGPVEQMSHLEDLSLWEKEAMWLCNYRKCAHKMFL